MELIFGLEILHSRGFQVVITNLPFFLRGALYTLVLTACSVGMGFIIGLALGLARLSRFTLLRFLATCYVDFFRGTPLYVQILLFYFGILSPLQLSGFAAGVIVLGLNSGAYIAEIVRAGIQSIDKGQMEAARSLGMTHWQAMQNVILPQAIKVVIPPLINEFTMLLKDTSLVSVIAVTELTYRGRLVIAATFQVTWIYFAIAIMYLIMTKTLSVFGAYVEKRLSTDDKD